MRSKKPTSVAPPRDSHCVLIMFAKAPVPGKVKTRIGKKLGDEVACQIHWELVTKMLERLRSNSSSDYLLHLHSDNIKHPAIVASGKKHGVHLRQQAQGDLGARMLQSFFWGFQHYGRVAICGSDSLDLDAARIGQLFSALESFDAALLPTADGGYIAIAANNFQIAKCLMQKVSWGSSEVAAQTIQNAVEHDVSLRILDTVDDIDTVEDLVGTDLADWALQSDSND